MKWRTITVACCLQCACVSWRPVPSIVELTGTQVVRVDSARAHVVLRNAHSCPDAASFTGTVLSVDRASFLVPPRCECSARPCAGVVMRPGLTIRVRQHDDDKTTGFVIGMVFAGAAAAALTVLGVMFVYAVTHLGGS